METHSEKNSRVARLLGSVALLGAGAGATVWLSPGGLGEADTTEVTKGASVSAYRSVAGAVADAPAWTGSLLEVASEGALVILGLLLARLCWTAVRRKDAAGAAGAVVIGVGTVAAYAISEALKLVVDEERPCRALRGVEAITKCPPTGDWSFPSNHATLAAALAVGPAMLWPRLAALTLPLAGAAALLRILVGVHYPHDVLAGALLGGTVVAAVLLAVMPLGVRARSLLVSRWWENDAGPVGHDGGCGPVVDTQSGQDRADMRLDRSFHHVQSARDLGQPAAEEGQHFALPGSEPIDPLTGGAAPTGQGPGAARREVRDHSGRDLR